MKEPILTHEIEEVANYLAEASEEERDNFCRAVTVFLIGVLRGIHGQQFVNEFLQAAMDDDTVYTKDEH